MLSTQFQGYLAVPESGKGPGVLVLHPWWGLNDTMKELCDRLAGEGFIACAPDLYHGQVAVTIEEAEVLSSKLDPEQAKADIAEAVKLLWERANPEGQGLGVMGFSLGAYFALGLAVDTPEPVRAVVLFYGTGPGDHPRSKAAYLGHFAQIDDYEPATEVEGLESALRTAGRPVTFYRYEGVGHWFFEPDRREAYNQPAAQLAWERTISFLRNTWA
jgi:carboxymethylenebutenolidase